MKAIQIVLAVVCCVAVIAFLAAGCLWANADGGIVPVVIAGAVMGLCAVGMRLTNG